jgi:hypothetical protein
MFYICYSCNYFKEHHRRHDHIRFQWTRTWIEGLPQLKVTNKDVFKVFSFCNTDCDFPVTPRYVLCRLITKHAFIFHVLSNTRSLPCWTYNLIISGNDHKSKHDALRSVKSLRYIEICKFKYKYIPLKKSAFVFSKILILEVCSLLGMQVSTNS